MELYQYQRKAVDDVLMSLDKHKKIAVDSCVSSGKSVMIAQLSIELEGKVLISLSISALIDQMVETFNNIGFNDYTVLKADHEMNYDSSKKICISMDNTVHSRRDTLPLHQYKYIVADEIHIRHDGQRFADIVDRVEPENIIGFSGTCFTNRLVQLDGFTKTIKTVSINKLISDGKLSDVKVLIPGWTTRLKVGSKFGSEFTKEDLDQQMNDSHRNKVIDTFIDNKYVDAMTSKGVWYCSHVEEAIQYADLLQKRGISAFAYHGSLKKDFRANLMDAFLTGSELKVDKDITLFNYTEPVEKIIPKVLVSVSTLTVGFSDTTLEYILETNSTASKSKSDQIIGRAHRKDDNILNKYLFDFGKNVERLGRPTDEFEPLPFDSDLKEARGNLAKLSMPYLEVLCKDENEIYEVSKEWYESEISKIINDTRPMSKLTIDEKIDTLLVSDDIETLVLVYVALFKDIHGDGYTYQKWDHKSQKFYPKDVKPYYSSRTIGWISEDWIKAFDQYPEFRTRWIKSFKTKARNLLKNKGNVYAIKFFISFLIDKIYEELSESHHYYIHNASSSGVITVYPMHERKFDGELDKVDLLEYIEFAKKGYSVSLEAENNISDQFNDDEFDNPWDDDATSHIEVNNDQVDRVVDIMMANTDDISEEDLPF